MVVSYISKRFTGWKDGFCKLYIRSSTLPTSLWQPGSMKFLAKDAKYSAKFAEYIAMEFTIP
jgi:hypothetical protein